MKKVKAKFSLVLMLILMVIVASGCASSVEKIAQAVKETTGADYLGEDVVLAAFYMEDGGFSETRYYPAKILTPATEETNGEYQVVSLIGDFDVAKEEKHWTDNVILESHPAEKEELKKGMIVLFTGKPAKEGLDQARWNRGIISSTDELYKDMVQIDFVWHLDAPSESDREKNVPVENIRIIDETSVK